MWRCLFFMLRSVLASKEETFIPVAYRFSFIHLSHPVSLDALFIWLSMLWSLLPPSLVFCFFSLPLFPSKEATQCQEFRNYSTWHPLSQQFMSTPLTCVILKQRPHRKADMNSKHVASSAGRLSRLSGLYRPVWMSLKTATGRWLIGQL